MKKLIIVLPLFALLLMTGCARRTQIAWEDSFPGSSKTQSIADTIWAGTDSDGDDYEFRFLANGELHYQSPSGFWDNGTWDQQGHSIYLEMNQGYAEYHGTLSGATMKGHAWNREGRNWTWTMERKQAGKIHE